MQKGLLNGALLMWRGCMPGRSQVHDSSKDSLMIEDDERVAKQVICMRTDLNMRKGKMVAQGSHASLGAVLWMQEGMNGSITGDLVKARDQWLEGPFTKDLRVSRLRRGTYEDPRRGAEGQASRKTYHRQWPYRVSWCSNSNLLGDRTMLG